jgi:hypothetical protein
MEGHPLRSFIEHSGLAGGFKKPSGLANAFQDGLGGFTFALGVAALREGGVSVVEHVEHVRHHLVALRLLEMLDGLLRAFPRPATPKSLKRSDLGPDGQRRSLHFKSRRTAAGSDHDSLFREYPGVALSTGAGRQCPNLAV